MRHVTVLGRSASRWWLALAAFAFVAVASVAVVVGRLGDAPDDVARAFLEATSCADLRALTDEQGRERLTARECDTLVDAARGRRTYADPDLRPHLDRALEPGEASVTRERARVTVTVTYADEAPAEALVVGLVPDGDRWLVQEWGLAGS